ncbi:MAG: glycosyltransferase [Caldilineaceae bacterium]
MTRIFYFCPDFPQPSGGVKTLYRHVMRLRQMGFDACIVHQRAGFQLSWHGIEAPVIYLEDRPQFTPQDVWVLPEVMADFARQTKHFPGQRVVLVLSWAPAYSRLQPGETWRDVGVAHVLAKSPLVGDWLRWSMDADVTLIPEFVDPARYFYDAAQKRPQISYMTRKDSSGELLRGILTRRGAPFDAFTWQPLRELAEDEYAAHLRQSALFLPTTTQEAMHVSVLDAMACGCLVVGYSGIGGADYMIGEGAAQNCILVENGNLPALGRRLAEVLEAHRADAQQFADIIRNGGETARQFQDAQAETEALRAFFSRLRVTPAENS